MSTIKVTPLKPFNKRVLLFERDDEHPGGLAFVYAKEKAVFEVAETGAVTTLIRKKLVKETTAEATHNTAQASEPVAPSDDDTATATAEPDVEKMSREELNTYAATLDIDPTAYATKPELLAAVNAARAETNG